MTIEATVVDRLREACRTTRGVDCREQDLPYEEWCERCHAAETIEAVSNTVDGWFTDDQSDVSLAWCAAANSIHSIIGNFDPWQLNVE